MRPSFLRARMYLSRSRICPAEKEAESSDESAEEEVPAEEKMEAAADEGGTDPENGEKGD